MFVNDCSGKRISLFALIDRTFRKSLNTEKKTPSVKPAGDNKKQEN